MFLALAIAMAFGAAAAPLEAEWEIQQMPEGGATASLHLASQGEARACALQCDLIYPAGKLSVVRVEPGPTAVAARKDAVFQDLGGGKLRIVIAGLNQTPLEEGVAVILSFASLAEGDPLEGRWDCRELRVADPMGREIAASVSGLPGTAASADSPEQARKTESGGWGCGRSGGSGGQGGFWGAVLLGSASLACVRRRMTRVRVGR